MSSGVIVVGGGVMGSSTAYALARHGIDVTVIEQFPLGHDRGSSHGTARIFRFSYPDPTYVSMAQEALPLWRALESEVGERLLTVTGGLDTGKALDDHARALDVCGATFEMIDGGDACERWPELSFDRGTPVLFQPDAGVVAADRAVAAFAHGARGAGATVMDGTRAIALEDANGGVTVRTDAGELRARAVVVAAGAWARGLLATAGIALDVRPTRETVAYFGLGGERVPPTLVDWGSPSIYALPSPGDGIKAGEHRAGPTIDPDIPGAIDDRAVERVARWVAERWPRADPRPHRAETCLYTNTPDEHFVLERHGRIVVASPCSGHGFKFAPLIGRRLAGLVRTALE
jgi:sarcosine oxidase